MNHSAPRAVKMEASTLNSSTPSKIAPRLALRVDREATDYIGRVFGCSHNRIKIVDSRICRRIDCILNFIGYRIHPIIYRIASSHCHAKRPVVLS